MEISLEDFRNIFNDVREKFIREYELEYGEVPKDTQIFKLAKYDQARPTLEDFIHADRGVRKMAKARWGNEMAHSDFPQKTTSGYLYKKMNRIYKDRDRRPERTVSINAPHNYLLFWYLGFDGYATYKSNREKQATVYIGYYYSYIKHKICKYELRINYVAKPSYNVPVQNYTVSQNGYHDDHREGWYHGYAYILQRKLQIILWRNIMEDRLRIFLEAGDKPEEEVAMRGVIVAVSSYHERPLTCTETVVIKRDDDSVTENDHLQIKRYLLLHSNNFRIKPAVINLHDMKTKKVSVDVLAHFVGVWRSYRFDEKFETVIQSILWVRNDYRILCFSNEYTNSVFKEQVCLVAISTNDLLATRTLSIDAYPEQGAKKISSFMLNIPNRGQKSLKGVINIVGREGSEPITRALLLEKDEGLSRNKDVLKGRARKAKAIIREVLDKITFKDLPPTSKERQVLKKWQIDCQLHE